jgi:hypothetical protein
MKKADFSYEQYTAAMDDDENESREDLDLRRLNNNTFSLLRMPSNLEQAFRKDYRSKAISTMRYFVYVLIGLYLLVVLPVALLIYEPHKDVWLAYAVYPIGFSLFIIWISTQLTRLNEYLEFSLLLGVFMSLSGTIYASIVLNHNLLGQIANCETVYVLIVAFSLLMLRSIAAMGSAIGAFLLAVVVAKFTGLHIPWLSVFFYFWVPLLICAITGYLMEHAARRDFILTLMHQQDKQQTVSEITTLINDSDDLNEMLLSVLGRVCAHTRWVAGRVRAVDDTEHFISAQYVSSKLVGDARLDIEQVLNSPLLPWVKRVIDNGTARWQEYGVAIGRVDTSNVSQ